MSYEKEPLYKLIKINLSDAVCAGLLGVFIGVVLWTMTN